MDGLLVRASYGESFRAPSLFELFGGIVSSFPSGLFDPYRCLDPTAGPGENGNAPDLAPPDCGEGQHQVDNGGNVNLQPEESESWNIGVVWEPTEDLFFQLDYFNYEHENIITQLGNQTIINLNDPNFVQRAYAPDGPITVILNSYINGAMQELSGVDFYFQWQFEGLGGLWTLANELTYYDSYEFTTFSGAVIEGVGGRALGDFPEIKDNFSVGYSNGNHSIQGVVHYRSEIEDHFASMVGSAADRCGARGNPLKNGSCKTGSWTTLDMSYTYNFTGIDGSIQVGCINCTDDDPPLSVLTGADTGAYFTSIDDPRGLVLFGRWTHSF